jgi:hypothetical protein
MGAVHSSDSGKRYNYPHDLAGLQGRLADATVVRIGPLSLKKDPSRNNLEN